MFLLVKEEVCLIIIFMNDTNNLKKELDEKIHQLFSNKKAYLEYIIQTKKNFLYRYLETSSDKDISIKSHESNELIAESFESNMGEAFKNADPLVKEGIKHLAKSVPKENKPAVKYGLKTIMEDIRGEHGKISIIAQINWDFPEYSPSTSKCKIKKVSFNYDDPNTFRKILALKYEEACEIFN